MTVLFNKKITGCEADIVRGMISEMMACIKSCASLSEDEEFEFCLILNELIANSTMHGNKGLCTKSISASIERTDFSFLRITIKDEGAGFNYEQLFDQIYTGKDCYSEGGRGLILVKALCDDVSFNETGNEVSILKKFKVSI